MTPTVTTWAAFKTARKMQRSLGTQRAAGFLRNQGYPLETAKLWLCGRAPA